MSEKSPAMTRQIFLKLMLIMIVFTFSNNGRATQTGSHNRKTISFIEASPITDAPVLPISPGPGLKPPVHKMQTPVMEELAKIHRFHKERVKRIKKHRTKWWISAKLLLIICHVMLLICAFMHATH